GPIPMWRSPTPPARRTRSIAIAPNADCGSCPTARASRARSALAHNYAGNVCSWINLAVPCISPPIGSSQADPKPTPLKKRIRQMLIVDGPIHLWEKGTPSAQHRLEPYSAEQAIAAMDQA